MRLIHFRVLKAHPQRATIKNQSAEMMRGTNMNVPLNKAIHKRQTPMVDIRPINRRSPLVEVMGRKPLRRTEGVKLSQIAIPIKVMKSAENPKTL